MKLSPPLSTGERSSPDDFDALLRAYFVAEVPDPWPAPPRVGEARLEVVRASAGRGLLRSRLALAASVAVLLTGTLVLPWRTPAGDRPGDHPTLSPGEARRQRPGEPLGLPKDRPADWRVPLAEDAPHGK